MHADQIELGDDTVRRLVADQFPAWAGLDVRRVPSHGTVNAIFRIGDELTARLPLRAGPAAQERTRLQHEAEASRRFATAAPFPAPTPVALGEPGAGYPSPWSVQTWVPGTIAKPDVEQPEGFARDLAALIRALRAADTGGRTFEGSRRGGDLRAHERWVQECFDRSGDLLDVPRLRRAWAAFRDLPPGAADVMSHGDLQPLNVVVAEGRLAGVLDTGDFAPADPALDAMAAWYFLGDDTRSVFRTELGADDREWERSKAWAFVQCLGAIWYYVDSNPAMYRMCRAALDRVMANTAA